MNYIFLGVIDLISYTFNINKYIYIVNIKKVTNLQDAFYRFQNSK